VLIHTNGWLSVMRLEPYWFVGQVYNVIMIKKYPYWIYVVGVFVAWAIVLLIARNFISSSRFHNLLIFACGFLLGVLGASLARKVYK